MRAIHAATIPVPGGSVNLGRARVPVLVKAALVLCVLFTGFAARLSSVMMGGIIR